MINHRLTFLSFTILLALLPFLGQAQCDVILKFDKDGKLLESNAGAVEKPTELSFILDVKSTDTSRFKVLLQEYYFSGVQINTHVTLKPSGENLQGTHALNSRVNRIEYRVVEVKPTHLLVDTLKKHIDSLNILLSLYDSVSDTTTRAFVSCLILSEYNTTSAIKSELLNLTPFSLQKNNKALNQIIAIHKNAIESGAPKEYVDQYIRMRETLATEIKAESAQTDQRLQNFSKFYAENSSELEAAKKLKELYTNAVKKNTILYQGDIYARDKKSLSRGCKDRPVYYLSHNVTSLFPPNHKKRYKANKEFIYELQNLSKPDSIKIQTETLTDETVTTSVLSPLIDDLDLAQLAKLALPQYSFYRKGIDGISGINLMDIKSENLKGNIHRNKLMKTIDSCSKKFLENENDIRELANYTPSPNLVSLTKNMPAPVPDVTPNYYSITTYLPDTFEESTRIKLSLKKNTAPFQYTYEHHKKQYVWVGAGLTYIFGSTNELSFEDGQITSENVGGMHPTAGFKIYPAGTRVLNKRPTFSPHIYLGLDFLRPLKSYQFGGGVDIFSGFAIGGGANLLLLEQPIIIENKLDRTYTYDAWAPYVNVTLDPALFIKIFQKRS